MLKPPRVLLPYLEIPFLRKFLAICIILLLSAWLGKEASLRWFYSVSLLVGGTFGVLFLTRRLEWGLLAVLPVTFLVPWTMRTGTNVYLNATFFLIVFLYLVWFLRMTVFKREVRLLASPLNLPVLLFILFSALSLVLGNSPLLLLATERASLPAQIGAWLIYTLSIGSLLLVTNIFLEIRWLKAWTWLFLGFGIVFLTILWSIGRYRTEEIFNQGIRTGVFWILLAAVGFSQFLFNHQLPMRWRLLCGGASIGCLIFTWTSGKGWIAGWLPPLMAVYLLCWLRSWKLGMVVTAVSVALIIPMFPQLLAEVNDPVQQWSTYTRYLVWEIMFEFVKISPVLGLGPANYYHYTPLYSYGGFFVKLNSHNNYWDIVVQYGLVGMVLFTWIIFLLARIGWRLRRQVTDGFSKAYVNGMLAVLVAILAAGAMADWFLPFLYNIGMPGFRSSIFSWIFLGGLLSLDAIQRRQKVQALSETG
jgi:O-antigen ligase